MAKRTVTTPSLGILLPNDYEMVFTITINAPRPRVFNAWTDPHHLASWWGPKVVTNIACEVEPRQGGSYRIVMRSPEGIEYPIAGDVLEVVEPERLVFTCDTTERPIEWHRLLGNHQAESHGGQGFTMKITVNFEDLDDKTLLVMRHCFKSLADRDANLRLGAIEGWSQSLDGLEEHLAKA